jgi:large subunit ribosomal protein L23
MKKIHYYDSIIAPLITEKATASSENNKVIFKVNSKANKKTIKKSVEKIFKVNVTKVNTIKIRNVTKLVRGRRVKKIGYKKAIITLKKGQSIDLTTGL